MLGIWLLPVQMKREANENENQHMEIKLETLQVFKDTVQNISIWLRQKANWRAEQEQTLQDRTFLILTLSSSSSFFYSLVIFSKIYTIEQQFKISVKFGDELFTEWICQLKMDFHKKRAWCEESKKQKNISIIAFNVFSSPCRIDTREESIQYGHLTLLFNYWYLQKNRLIDL